MTYCLYGWLCSAIFTIVFVVISPSRFNFCADTSKRLHEKNGLLIMRLNRAVYRYFKVQTACFFFPVIGCANINWVTNVEQIARGFVCYQRCFCNKHDDWNHIAETVLKLILYLLLCLSFMRLCTQFLKYIRTKISLHSVAISWVELQWLLGLECVTVWYAYLSLLHSIAALGLESYLEEENSSKKQH